MESPENIIQLQNNFTQSFMTMREIEEMKQANAKGMKPCQNALYNVRKCSLQETHCAYDQQSMLCRYTQC